MCKVSMYNIASKITSSSPLSGWLYEPIFFVTGVGKAGIRRGGKGVLGVSYKVTMIHRTMIIGFKKILNIERGKSHIK